MYKCKYCKDTGKLILFNSVVECTECKPTEKSEKFCICAQTEGYGSGKYTGYTVTYIETTAEDQKKISRALSFVRSQILKKIIDEPIHYVELSIHTYMILGSVKILGKWCDIYVDKISSDISIMCGQIRNTYSFAKCAKAFKSEIVFDKDVVLSERHISAADPRAVAFWVLDNLSDEIKSGLDFRTKDGKICL